LAPSVSLLGTGA